MQGEGRRGELAAVRQRFQTLESRCATLPDEQREELGEALGQLAASVEELLGADEELREMNEQLLAAYETTKAVRRRFHDLFIAAPEGYLITDPAGTIKEANLAAASLLRVEEEAISGRPLRGYVAPESRGALGEWLASLAAHDNGGARELLLQPAAGQAIPVTVSVAATRDGEGRLGELCWAMRDLSHLKEAEETLRESEERYRSLFEQATDAIALIDPETTGFVALNQVAQRTLGYAREEFAGLALADLIVGESVQALAGVGEQITPGVASAGTALYRTKTGSVREARVSTLPVRLSGKPLVQALWRDVTEENRDRQQAEAVSRLTARLAEAETVSDLGTIVCEETGRLFKWDAHYLALRNSSSDPFRGLTYVDTCPDGTRIHSPENGGMSFVHPAVQAVLRGKPVLLNRAPGEEAPRLKRFGDESRLSASLMFAPLRSRNTVVGVLSVQSYTLDRYGEGDLNLLLRLAEPVALALARACAEQTLQGSEERFHRLLEINPEALILTDAQGTISMANRPAAQLWGGEHPQELVGRHALGLVAPEDHHRVAGLLRETRERGEGRAMPCTVIQKDGTRLPLELKLSVLTDSNGQPESILSAWRDLPRRERAGLQSRQVDKLASLAVLSGGLAHELQNPLSIVSSCSQLLAGNPCETELHRECAQRIQAATERCRHLIDRLLSVARPQKKQPLSEIDVSTVARRSLGLLSEQLTARSVKWQTHFAGDVPLVRGDEQLLEQVCTNMTLNACNAMPRGGTLTVSVSPTDNGGVALEFADTGKGIVPEHLGQVFDPFFTTAAQGEGAGLGLALCDQIVRQMKGTIEVESRVDFGTRFLVWLPAWNRGDGSTGPQVPEEAD